MENFLKDKDKDVKFKASKDILDRAWYKATDKVQLSGSVSLGSIFDQLEESWQEEK
jgi:hypothetical protein